MITRIADGGDQRRQCAPCRGNKTPRRILVIADRQHFPGRNGARHSRGLRRDRTRDGETAGRKTVRNSKPTWAAHAIPALLPLLKGAGSKPHNGQGNPINMKVGIRLAFWARTLWSEATCPARLIATVSAQSSSDHWTSFLAQKIRSGQIQAWPSLRQTPHAIRGTTISSSPPRPKAKFQ